MFTAAEGLQVAPPILTHSIRAVCITGTVCSDSYQGSGKNLPFILTIIMKDFKLRFFILFQILN